MSKIEEFTKENEDFVETSDDESVDESTNETETQIDGDANKVEQNDMNNINEVTFESLGVVKELCEACEQLKWKHPTSIQRESLPVALKGRDIIGLAETGSGKTGSFAIPIIQALLEKPQRLFALVLTPTRELAYQISEQFEALGAQIGIKCAVIVGGMDMMTQSIALAKKPVKQI